MRSAGAALNFVASFVASFVEKAEPPGRQGVPRWRIVLDAPPWRVEDEDEDEDEGEDEGERSNRVPLSCPVVVVRPLPHRGHGRRTRKPEYPVGGR